MKGIRERTMNHGYTRHWAYIRQVYVRTERHRRLHRKAIRRLKHPQNPALSHLHRHSRKSQRQLVKEQTTCPPFWPSDQVPRPPLPLYPHRLNVKPLRPHHMTCRTTLTAPRVRGGRARMQSAEGGLSEGRGTGRTERQNGQRRRCGGGMRGSCSGWTGCLGSRGRVSE